jgi:enamine deaminase RidA (YjgF/YER057c/UK114 family)
MKFPLFLFTFFLFTTLILSCNRVEPSVSIQTVAPKGDTTEYFNLRPELEKAYGYTHAVRIGDDLKISGAVSMDDKGIIVAPGNMEQQMKNCYADLEKILQHYGYTYDDVVAENVYTTDMKEFERVSGFRNSIYKNNSRPAPGWK